MRERGWAILKLVAGPLMLAMLLRVVGVETLWATLRAAQWPYLLLALAAYLGTVALRAWRWQWFLRAQGLAIPLPRLIFLDFVGSFFNVVLPSSVGGDVVKFHELSQCQPASEARVASSLLADRICGLLVLMLLGVALGPLAAGRVPAATLALLALASAGAVAGLALLLHGGARGWAERHLPGWAWLWQRRGLRGLYDSLAAYRAPLLWRAAGVGLLFNGLMLGVNVALGLAFGVRLALPLYAVAVPLISLALALPLSVNGLGVREGAYVLFLGQVGIAPPLALSMGLAYYSCTVLAGVVGGALYLLEGVRGLRAEPRPSVIIKGEGG